MNSCSYCHLMVDSRRKLGQHVRWCGENPASAANRTDAKSKSGNQFTKAKELGLPVPPSPTKGKPGKPGYRHTDEAKRKIKAGALASPHRRLVRSIVQYTKVDGSSVQLDSSWEVALASRLDSLGIEWLRPDPLPWLDDDGITHNYFPDFFLPDHNIFLDPKGPGARIAQEEKIKILTTQYQNVFFLFTLAECNEFDITNFSPSFNG